MLANFHKYDFFLISGLGDSSQCTPCPGGQYCAVAGLENPTGPCTEGYYCELGMDRAEPTGGDATSEIGGVCMLPGGQTGVGDVCPLGYYCPTGKNDRQKYSTTNVIKIVYK